MNLLAILLALGALRLLERTPAVTHDLSAVYVQRLQGLIRGDAFWTAAWAPWLLAAVPVVLVALVDARLPLLLQLLLSAAVLWLCLGPRELSADLRAWLSAGERGDDAEAQERARRLWTKGDGPRFATMGRGGPERPAMDDRAGASESENGLAKEGESDQESGHQLSDLFVASHERLFGVLLWFFALGPAGALLYRLGRRLPERWPGDARYARLLHALLAFVPARVTAVLFAAAGSADDVIREWQRWRVSERGDWVARTWDWLAQIAPASLNVEDGDGGPATPASLRDSAREFLQLQFRALLILLALFAIFTVGNLF